MRILRFIYTLQWKCLGAIAIALLLSACAEDGVIEETPRVTIPESQELVSTTLYGRVIDELGAPIFGAQVSYLSGRIPQQLETDEDGYFLLPDVSNKGRAAYVSISYQGKFDAYRKYSVLSNRYNYTEVKMLDRKVIGTIQASEGGTLLQTNGAKITLPAGDIVDLTGANYNGEVNVAMTWIDPSADDLSQRMVGDLSGIDSDGGYRSLSSFGMLQVELLGANDQLLNLEKGAEAQLEFPIPASMQSDATPSIPLWSYDEVIGTWIQEGIAIKEGSVYVGTVGHFSSWNVDHMTDPIEIKGKVLWNVEDGTQIGGAYLQVYVCSENIGRKGGWLCEDGSFRFYNFPKDEEFKIKVLDKCGNEIFNETYGPYTEDTDIGAITVASNEKIVKIVGNVLNCDDMIPANAQLSVLQGERRLSFPIDSLGGFEFSFDFCSDEKATLSVVDLDALLSQTVLLDPISTVIEVNDLKICDDLTDFVAISFDGGPEELITPNVQLEIMTGPDSIGTNGNYVSIRAERKDSLTLTFFNMHFKEIASVPATVEAAQFFYLSSESCGNSPDVQITVTTFDIAPGGLVEGTFSGEVECVDPFTEEEAVRTVNGRFKISIQ